MMKYFVFFAFFFVMFLLLTACATIGSKDCQPGLMTDNGYPCWVNKMPDQGVVVSMAEHVDSNKTRDILFKKALIELAASQNGMLISENSIVKKSIRVSGNDNVSQQVQVITLATVKTTNESITVKAKIKAEWKHPSSRKTYLWVVTVD